MSCKFLVTERPQVKLLGEQIASVIASRRQVFILDLMPLFGLSLSFDYKRVIDVSN